MFRWISRWWKQNQQQSNSIGNRNEPNADAYEGPPAIIRVADALTDEAEYRQHDRQYKDRQIRTNRWIILATVVTAAGTIWQGILTRQALRTAEDSSHAATTQLWAAIGNLNWQARSMDNSAADAQKGLVQARDQFAESERPYIWVTVNGSGAPEFFQRSADMSKGQAVWSLHYTNYGKAPAYGLQFVDHEIKTGGPFVVMWRKTYRKDIGVLVPPGKDDFATIPSLPTISKQEFDQLLKVDDAIAIRTRIEYTNADGTLYETGICESHLASGAVKYCDEGNYIKNLDRNSK